MSEPVRVEIETADGGRKSNTVDLPLDFGGVPWTPKDRPLFSVAERFILATDDELQWIFYRRQGKTWRSYAFPTTRETVERRLRWAERDWGAVILPGVRAAIAKFPDHFSRWAGRKAA